MRENLLGGDDDHDVWSSKVRNDLDVSELSLVDLLSRNTDANDGVHEMETESDR